MSFDAVREALFGTFRSEFAFAHPGVLVAFENTKYSQPRNAPWVFVALVPGDSHRKEVSSNKLFCHYGVVNVACMVPEDTGTKSLQEMSETAFRILADRNFVLPGDAGRLTTYGMKRRNRGLISGYQTFNVLCEYRHEAVLERL
jgi:hypothetical protein